MKAISTSLLFILALLTSTCANAAGSMLRIACEGSNKGADVEVNGKFKGQCPLDLQVPEGLVKLKVWQAVDELEEHVYVEEMRIGDGVVKKVDVELGPSQLSAKGEQYLNKYWAAKLHEDEQRANSGDAKAMMEMVEVYSYGYHGMLERSDEKKIYWIRKAADVGHPDAMYELSEFYGEGKEGFPKSDEQSQVWRLRAAEAGNESAIAELAWAYSEANDAAVKKDDAQSASWSRKLFEVQLKKAKAGDPASMRDVGAKYCSGDGVVVVNRDECREWYKRSAASYRTLSMRGDWSAMSSLSKAVLDEKGERMSADQKQLWSKLAKERMGWFYGFKELRAFVRNTGGATR